MIFTLVYISRETKPFDEPSLVKLLEEARENNQQMDITGMLLYKEGEFMQALEGDQDDVEALYEKINSDDRHQNVVVLSRKPAPERIFKRWSMGFESLSEEDLKKIDGFEDFEDLSFSSDRFMQFETAINLLSRFYHSS